MQGICPRRGSSTSTAGCPGRRAGRQVAIPCPIRRCSQTGCAGSGSDTVVAYDDAGGVIAARLVWMLRVTGHDAALLDGGLDAWTGPLEHGAGDPPAVPGDFSSRPWPAERLADLAELSAFQSRGVVLVDARNADRYRGDDDPVD